MVEIDHETRVEVRRILEGAGHFVVSAANGIDALGLLDKISPPSLILLTANLPMLDGRLFIEALKKESRYSSTPVAQLVSAGEESLPGVFATLSKPVKPSELLKMLDKCK